MLFNSIDFAIFLPIVFILYWFVFGKENIKMQNMLIVIASYFFYGYWDWRFLSLIFVSTMVDFLVGIQLGKKHSLVPRRLLLAISIAVNLGLLGFFKYYNFFLDNFITAFSFFGVELQGRSLNVILPVGISFYTFQTLSYTLDVYKKKMKPTKDFISFAAYVSFFPQLVAGPIERATHLLPQFFKKRSFDYAKATDGMRQILWGLFKKIVIADTCAKFVDTIFSNSSQFSGSTLVLGAVLFAFQIYGDFSGYSDIAIGTARLFGFNLMTNFAYPYFSRDIAEFWRRWHISLSTWFRDYLYIPLGGSRGGLWMKIRNTFIIFLVSGFWHGANWTFIAWGALNALYFLPLMIFGKNRRNIEIIGYKKKFPSIGEILGVIVTFALTCLAWIFFRAESVSHAITYISSIFTAELFTFPPNMPYSLLLGIVFLIVIEWFGRRSKFPLSEVLIGAPRYVRWGFYYFLILLIIINGGDKQQFIYFQF
ncbi:MAG: MBOAT family O-acyltransferase [Candidatus Zixiibacteriota bacterium]